MSIKVPLRLCSLRCTTEHIYVYVCIKIAVAQSFLCDNEAACICSIFSSLPGSTLWFSSSAWRMKSASRRCTIISCACPATGTQLRSPWSSSVHKVLASHLICSFFPLLYFLFRLKRCFCGVSYHPSWRLFLFLHCYK